MKHRTKEVSFVNTHFAILLVFALLSLVPFIPTEITGSSVFFFNDSESNTTEIPTEAIISDINISTEITNVTTEILNETSEPVIQENITEVNKTVVETNVTEPQENISEPAQNITEPIPEVNITSNVTQVPEVNISTEATIIEENVTQYQAVIGQPVKWKKVIKLNQEATNVEINLPKDAKITSIKKIEDNQSIDITQEEAISTPSLLTGFAIFEETNATSLVIEQNVTEVEIEYETEAPTLSEEDIKGGVRLTLSSETHYENVYTEINISESRGELIRLYWIVNGTRVLQPIIDYDDNNFDGFIDEIAFIAPHLSTEVFELIYITKAEHLDANYTFIADIYNETVALDDVWSEPIYSGEYVRVTFERNLTSDNDITFYARNNQSSNTTVGVYLYNTSIKIAEFPIINETKYYRLNLTELNESYATFDLRIKNLEGDSSAYLEFDHIVDPTITVIKGNEAHDVGFAIMDESLGEIILAWCDDVADLAYWEGFYTNGSNFTAKHPFQTTASDDCRIGISALNNSDFAAALIDQSTIAAPDWVVYAKTKTNGSIRQRTLIDTDVNNTAGGFDVAVAALNATDYVSFAMDDGDADVSYSIHTRAAGTTVKDLNLTIASDAGCLDQDCVDIATIGNVSSPADNRTYAMVWYNDGQDIIQLEILGGNNSNQNISGATQSAVIVDALSAGQNSTAVSVTGLYDGRIVVGWCDDADQDISFKTYDVAINSSIVSNVSGEVDVNLTSGSCAGPVGTKVDVAALNTTDGQFVIAWDDARVNQTSFAIYNSSGNSILGQTIIAAASSVNEKAISVIGYDVMRNVSVCAYAPLPVFAVAYDNSTDFIWETYLNNGSAWSGTCVTPFPIAALVNPSDTTNNLSNSHVFVSTATDDFNLVNATLYHNISGSWVANQTVGRNGTSNTSSFNVSNIPFGTYLWNVQWCDNSSQCAQAPSNFTFTVAQCGSITNSYTIDSNRTASTILANTSCMNIDANNLDISCTNATLIGNSLTGIAFNATGRTNITIRGCVVQGFNTSVFFSRTNFSLIDNNTFRNNSGPSIHLLTSSDNNIIQNNSIAGLANESVLTLSAIRLIGSSNNNITNNTVNNNASAAIQLITNSNNNSVVNNNVSSNNSAGILIDGNANFTLVENNTIFSNNSLALFSRSNSNNSFINNSATSTGADAIAISGNNITILRNIGNETIGNGFDGSLGLSNSTIGNNIFFGGPSDHAFVMAGDSNVIFNNTITSRATVTNAYTLWVSGSNNTIRNNTITATNHTAIYVSGTYTTNYTGNLITSLGGDGIRIEYASNNTFNDNEIRTNGSFAIIIISDPEIEESFNNSFNNTVLKTNNSWIQTGNASFHNNFSNTSFIMSRGRIVILPRITIGNMTNVTLANLNVTQNISYINSTAIPVFNTSGIIALNGVTFTDPRPTISTEDNGTFRNCNAPECNELSFTGNVFTFNTTHFTSHSASESGGVSNSAPTITRVDINSTDPTTNNTDQSIIAYPRNVTDSNGDRVQNITNWFVNGTSFALANLPFETNITSGVNNIKDYSPLGNNGTLLGNTIWANTSDCVRGGCYRFDGNGDSINVSADNDLSFTNRQNFTISAWINSTSSLSISSATGIVAHHHNDNNGWALSYVPSGQRIHFLISGTGSTISTQSTATSAPINKTNFVVATWETINSSSANLSLWINGQFNTAFDTSINLSSSLKNLTIGDNYGAYFNGTIDEILIFNRSLSKTQIEALNSSRGNWLNITAAETGSAGENWSACVTPNDATTDGTQACSQNFTIINAAPTLTRIDINSTNPTNNNTNQNITIYPRNLSDIDGNNVTNVTNWFVNGTSWTVLNMPFEDEVNRSNRNVEDYSTFSNNGTLASGDNVVFAVIFNASGGYDGKGAYEFNGTTGSWINIPNTDSLNLSRMNFSIEVRFKTGSALRVVSTLIAQSSGSFTADQRGIGAILYTNSTTLQAMISNFSKNDTVFGTKSITDSKWHHAIFTVNSTTLALYYDGVLDNKTARTLLGDQIQWDTGMQMRIGEHAGGTTTWNGTIDEVRIYNKTLSAQQVNALYQNRTDLIVAEETTSGENWSACVTPNDGTIDGLRVCSQNLTILAPPTIVLNNPTNATSNISNQHRFNATVADPTGFGNATLYHNISGSFIANQTLNITDNTVTSFGTNFLVANIPLGGYIWNILACDPDNQCGFADSNFTFTVVPDTTSPTINLINPPDGTSNSSTSHVFFSNATDNAALANATLFHNINGTFAGNQSATVNGTFNTSSFNVANLADGTYTWNVKWCDTSSNCGFASNNFTFTVSTAQQVSAPSGGGNPAGASGRTQTIITPPIIPTGRINISEPRTKEALAKTINLQLPLRVRTIDWFWLLILAILLAAWIIKKEWKYLKEYRKEVEKVYGKKQAHKVRLHIFKDVVKSLVRSVRILAVSIEDLIHGMKLAVYAARKRRIQLAKLAALKQARHARYLASVKKLLIVKQLQEEKLLELERARRERLARLELLKKHRLEIKNKIAAIRTRLLQSVSLTEKEMSNIESTFKASLPYLPELMPHPEVKAVSQYENDSKEFRYLYSKVDEHIKDNNLEAAKEAYDALITIFNQLIQATTNKYELISAAKEIQTRLSLAILSAKAREKVEEFKPVDTEIEIEKLPPAKKYSKSEKLTEEEAQIDYLKSLLKKNEYKKAIELYKSINPNFSRRPIVTPRKVKPIELEKIKPQHHEKETIKQQEDLRLSYLRELLNKNEYKEAIKLYDSIYQRNKQPLKRPKKVEPVFIEDIEPIKYEKLGSVPSESELNIDSLRKLLKNNDYKTARKVFNRVFKE